MKKKRHTRYKVIAHFDGHADAEDVFAVIIEFRIREKRRERTHVTPPLDKRPYSEYFSTSNNYIPL